jgi:hypothetical protein
MTLVYIYSSSNNVVLVLLKHAHMHSGIATMVDHYDELATCSSALSTCIML